MGDKRKDKNPPPFRRGKPKPGCAYGQGLGEPDMSHLFSYNSLQREWTISDKDNHEAGWRPKDKSGRDG